MNRITHLLIMLLFAQLGFSQYIPIDLSTKVLQSEIIIEGEIISQIYFLNSEGFIYTKNILSPTKLFKGNINSTQPIEIVTRGGELDGITQNWTHLLDLDIGDYGMFFLISDSQGKYSYRTYSSSQGFLRYIRTPVLHANDILNTYRSIQKDIYNPIKNITNEEFRILNSSNKKLSENCLNLNIKPIIPNSKRSTELNFSITASLSEMPLFLYDFTLEIGYDSTELGQNVIDSGVIRITNGIEISSSQYTVSAVDVLQDRIRISISSIEGQTNLLLLDDFEKEILQVSIQFSDVIFPNLFLDKHQIIQSNIFINPETFESVNVSCVKTTLGGDPRACPIITSFNHPTAAAGVGEYSLNNPEIPGVIVIKGKLFGKKKDNEKYKPAHMVLGFKNAGPSGADWCYPPEKDIISWSDEEIEVRVPSINEDGSIETYAGSGQLVIWDNKKNCGSYSIDELYIPFAATNLSNNYLSNNKRESILTKMINANMNGGYTLYYGDDFLDIDGSDIAFERALDTWRCTTKVNMVIKSKDQIPSSQLNSACLINIDGTLPNGVLSTLAYTSRSPNKCPDKTHSTQPKFDIFFNKYIKRKNDSLPVEINWYTGSEPMDSETDIFPNRDLQTVALHEIGHGSLLLHTNNEGDVMYKVHENTKRSLFVNDEEGGIHCVNLSSISPHCKKKMVKYTCTSNSVTFLQDYIISINPNPVESILHVNFDSQFSGKIEVTDVYGRLLMTIPVKNEKTSKITMPDGNGLFFIHIYNESNQIISTSKIVKQ